MEAAVNEKMFDTQHRLVPAEPGDHSRVWGVNSPVPLPAFGGKVSESAADQSSCRTPQPVKTEKCAQSGAFLATSDYDASLTAPGEQNVDVVPGSKKKMSQVGAGARASGKPSRLWFADCTFEDKVSEELAENMDRYADSYELERGFKRRSSRLRQGGPKASAFFPVTPSRCAAPAWMLYMTFQDKRAARRVAAQFSRMCGSFPDAPELRGGLFGSRFAPQYAARAQALSQLFAFAWLSHSTSLDRKEMETDVLTSPLSVRQKRMLQGSVSRKSYEAPQSFVPREYNPVIGSVVGALVFAGIVNVKDEHASKLRRCFRGTAPGAVESHFVSPSDCFEW